MAGKTTIKEHIAGARPISPRGRRDYLLRRNNPTSIGNHLISWTLGMGRGYIGSHIPLISDHDSPDKRAEVVVELLSGLVDHGYEHIFEDDLPNLKVRVSESLMKGATDDTLHEHKFQVAIPLQNMSKCCGTRSYFVWDKALCDWVLKCSCNLSDLSVPGNSVLLIARRPPIKKAPDIYPRDDFSDLLSGEREVEA
jgi:hypothetical protein